MTWKLGAGAGVSLLALIAAGSAQDGSEHATPRSEYRRPDAIPFPETNPYSSAKAELGRALFFDPILSDTRTRSCGTCHDPARAWSDGRPRGVKRDQSDMALRTSTLLNLAWAEGPLGWEGKFADLERLAFVPVVSAANMNLSEAEAVARLSAEPSYVQAFAAAFPEAPTIARERIEQALATFQRLIVARRAPFDKWIEGDEDAIGAPAKRGFALFNGKARCASCHSGWAFTDGSFHDIGTAQGDDIGRGRFFPGSVALRYAFKTPTLRAVAQRAPYMHDGSVPSLSAVIELYDRGGIDRPSRSRDIRPLRLTGEEKADLLAFLDTLGDAAEPGSALASSAPEFLRP